MSSKYLNDRYGIEGTRLRPEGNHRDQILVDRLRILDVEGTVYHLMEEIPDQFEDFYTIMVDDRLVVRFALGRGPDAVPEDIQIETLNDHRQRIGQGKARIRLDRWVDATRILMADLRD